VTTHSFPTQLTSFVGRDSELDELGELIRSTRVLTLTGPGGSGKTRLASALCADVADRYADGTWFVDLAPVADGRLVASAVASAVGVTASPDVLTSLVAGLGDQERLLLIDNCEQVLASVSELVGAVVSGCPHISVVATSRHALGLGSETVWQVPAMRVPDSTADLAELTRYDAVRLFADRATMANRNFELSSSNAAGIVRLIARLDGIPLALELAAAWIRMLTPGQIAQRLDDRFRLLARGSSDAPERHQTLRAAIDWSYELLGDLERMVFDRLSVFRGGFPLEAAEVICSDDDVSPLDVLEALHELVESNLVVADTSSSQGRYGQLETIREYASERLRASGAKDVHNRHLRWLKTEVVRPEVIDFHGEMEQWLDRLDLEQDNIRVALAWSLDGGDPDEGLAMAVGLESWWSTRGLLAEGVEWMDRVIAAAQHVEPFVEGRAYIVLAALHFYAREFEASHACAERALPLMLSTGDDHAIFMALRNMGNAANELGERDEARRRWDEALVLARRMENNALIAQMLNALAAWNYPDDLDTMEALLLESLEIARESSDRMDVAYALGNLGAVALVTERHDVARTRLEEALAIWREIGDQRMCAATLNNLADLAHHEGELAEAQRLFEAALAASREVGAARDVIRRLHNLARLAVESGAVARAAELYAESLDLARSERSRADVLSTLEGLAWAAAASGVDAERAARMLGVVDVVRASSDSQTPDEQQEIADAAVERARAALGDDPYDRAFARGRSDDLDDTADAAARLAAVIAASPSGGDGALSFASEGEVWVIAFEGRTLRMQDTKGMQHLATLVASPGCEIHVLDLVAGPGGPRARAPASHEAATARGGDAGDMLDGQARSAYERRLSELQEELDEAESFNDQARATKLRAEFDALVEELKRATGLGGRSRKAASEAERARLNVQRTIKAAVQRIVEHDRALGRHLDGAVRTGTYCSYRP
jgi:predicted ATPase